jgi:hypothetical protein
MTAARVPELTTTRARSPRRRLVRRLGAAACVLALAPTLSAAAAEGTRSPGTSAAAGLQAGVRYGPPPVRLTTTSLTMALVPSSACWTTGQEGICYDGAPPSPLPSLGGLSGPVELVFARDGWHFRLTVKGQNGDRTRIDLVRTSPRSWRLALGSLAPGHYRADLFGRGPQGDVAGAFAFTLT